MRIIYHHLGLGDAIICNGLVRKIYKPNDIVLCKEHNAASVSFMYRDLPISVASIKGDDVALKMIQNNSYIAIGYAGENWTEKESTFEKIFYAQAGVPFNEKWDSFFVARDAMREFPAPNAAYAFEHMDEKRNFVFKTETSLPRIRVIPGVTNNIWDYCSLIANATEIHCIESTFMFIADLILTRAKRLIAYRSARALPMFELPTMKKKWEIR